MPLSDTEGASLKDSHLNSDEHKNETEQRRKL